MCRLSATPGRAYTSRTLAAPWTRLLFVLCACLYASQARAELRIDLITVEPGPALYERFGHTALRVYFEGNDTVYSFGAAPFNDPRFIWKFARGEGEFLVVSEPYSATLARYRDADRTLLRQRLLLPPERLIELAMRLYEQALPPRNRYLYDQLYDNCATRVRDLIDRVSGGALVRAAAKHKLQHRYRDDTLGAMAGHPIGAWALDLIGGRHQDLPVTSFHEMYLPTALGERVAEAELVLDGRHTPLAAPAERVFERRGPPLSRAAWTARLWMLALAFLLCALALGFSRSRSRPGRRAAAISAGLLCVWSGLFGLLVVPLTLLSHVHNFSPNENACLFWPTDLLLAAALYRGVVHERAPGRLCAAYLALRGLSLALTIVLKVAGVWTQHNLVFVALAVLFALPVALFGWRVRLARTFASR
jgi:hypothetical protein